MRIFGILAAVVSAIGLIVLSSGRFGHLPGGATPQPAITALKAPPHVVEALRSAVNAANAEAKTLVYHFSLVNCGPCAQFDRDILSTQEWKDYSKENLKIIDILMPASFTSADVKVVQNMDILQSITESTKISGAFPTFAVLSSDGRILGAHSGYDGPPAARFINWVETLRRSDTHRPTQPTLQTSTSPSGDSLPGLANKSATNNLPKGEPKTYLRLTGIATGSKPLAMMHSGVKTYTFAAGEDVSMETPGGKLDLHCETVSKDGVVITLLQPRERLEMKMQ